VSGVMLGYEIKLGGAGKGIGSRRGVGGGVVGDGY